MAGKVTVPDSTAVRVALWRAMHMQVDPPPHVLEDDMGLQLAAPDDGWRRRPDMDADGTRLFRASIVARARFIEDLVVEQFGRGVSQYVILGAGLDSFAQRRPEIASKLKVFEVDKPGPQSWKRQRLNELGFDMPEWLRLVPVDFETDNSWLERLAAAGFDASRSAWEAVVPPLWPYEMVNVLIGAIRRRRITEAQMQSYIGDLLRLPISSVLQSAEMIFQRLEPLATQHQLTAYDTAYLELALSEGIALATKDDALLKAAQSSGIQIMTAAFIRKNKPSEK